MWQSLSVPSCSPRVPETTLLQWQLSRELMTAGSLGHLHQQAQTSNAKSSACTTPPLRWRLCPWRCACVDSSLDGRAVPPMKQTSFSPIGLICKLPAWWVQLIPPIKWLRNKMPCWCYGPWKDPFDKWWSCKSMLAITTLLHNRQSLKSTSSPGEYKLYCISNISEMGQDCRGLRPGRPVLELMWMRSTMGISFWRSVEKGHFSDYIVRKRQGSSQAPSLKAF